MQQLQRVSAGRFAITGALGLATVSAVRGEGLLLFSAEPGSLRVDLAAVSNADSSALALMVDWLAWAAGTGRELHYDNIPPELMALARICDVGGIVTG